MTNVSARMDRWALTLTVPAFARAALPTRAVHRHDPDHCDRLSRA
jgi:hypothetical protein